MARHHDEPVRVWRAAESVVRTSTSSLHATGCHRLRPLGFINAPCPARRSSAREPWGSPAISRPRSRVSRGLSWPLCVDCGQRYGYCDEGDESADQEAGVGGVRLDLCDCMEGRAVVECCGCGRGAGPRGNEIADMRDDVGWDLSGVDAGLEYCDCA